ncbi:carcinoembryonic antigen-related cell adhesion molecule 3 [Phodopus roborovskii]|uniref:carcinoembryonic antigen-related cell adhesion molecule 3 n=1 Tax=Phodopus roborovskii TaxID=109678 RepID=UPI0021E41229|nr:carcinoembryonic antigen-related cell adhesion molecule 3 [Phodopus roborovskii]
METSSVLLCNGCISWQWLLITASILTCWHLSTTTAHVTIDFVPPHVVEGENVLLLVQDLPENLTTLAWYKEVKIIHNIIAIYSLNNDLSVPGPLHSGRETVYRNGSLLLRNVTKKDIGIYTLQTLNKLADTVSTTSMYLLVYTPHCGCPSTCAQPAIETVPSSIAEGESVLLVAHHLPKNLRAFFWYKGGIVSKDIEVAWHQIAKNTTGFGPAHSGREIVYSNGSLLLQNVTWNDTGFYTLRTLSTELKTKLIRVQLQLDTSHCGQHPSTQPTVESVPPRVAEGGSALLVVHNLPKNIRAIFWYKGAIAFKNYEVVRHKIATDSTVLGLAHSGRETLYSNGSLLLQSVTRNDTGFYTLRTLTSDLKVGLVHVKLLVDTSLSVCCNPFTSVPLMIEPVPQNAARGESVLLLVHNLPEDLQAFAWYKSGYSTQILKIAEYSRDRNYITQWPDYSKRAMVYNNGSLLLQDVMETDAGIYTLQTLNRDFKVEKAHLQLHVYTCRLPPTAAQLSIELLTPNVVEGEDALLLALNVPENLEAFFWYLKATMFNSRVIARKDMTNNIWIRPAYIGRVTVYPNGSLLIHNTTQKDAGFYSLQTLSTDLEIQETHVDLHIYSK